MLWVFQGPLAALSQLLMISYERKSAYSPSLQNLRNYEMPFGSDAWRLGILDLDRGAVSDVLSLVVARAKLLTRIITCTAVSFTILSALLAIPAELFYICKMTFHLHRVLYKLCTVSFRR